MTLTWYDVEIQKAIVNEAWVKTMYWLQRQFVQEFTTNKWAWPTGQSPRDIIDTGALRNRTMSPEQAKLTELMYQWVWNIDYALPVHNGATFFAGPFAGRSFPPRPWTKKPMEGLKDAYLRLAKDGLRALP